MREAPRYAPLWALPLSLGPGLAWLAAAGSLGPEGFAAGALGENLLGRFFRGSSHARPFYYYLYQLPVDFLPWTLLWPAVWLAARRRVFVPAPRLRPDREPERRAERGDARAERVALALHGERRREGVRRAWRFLLAWVRVSLVFFSLSGGKRGLYLLPAFPALALLVADATCRELAGRSSWPRALGAGLAALAALVGLAGAAALGIGAFGPSFEKTRELLASVGRGGLLAFGCASLAVATLGFAAWIVTRRHGSAALRRAAIPVVCAGLVELSAFLLLYPALDAARSPRPIAAARRAARRPRASPSGW